MYKTQLLSLPYLPAPVKVTRARPYMVATSVLVDHFAAAMFLWMLRVSKFEFQALRFPEFVLPLFDRLFRRARLAEGCQVPVAYIM